MEMHPPAAAARRAIAARSHEATAACDSPAIDELQRQTSDTDLFLFHVPNGSITLSNQGGA